MENGSTATCQSKEEKPMKATRDWLNDQLLMGSGGDDALVVDAQIEEEQNEQSV